jgi:hypothetical protein
VDNYKTPADILDEDLVCAAYIAMGVVVYFILFFREKRSPTVRSCLPDFFKFKLNI